MSSDNKIVYIFVALDLEVCYLGKALKRGFGKPVR